MIEEGHENSSDSEENEKVAGQNDFFTAFMQLKKVPNDKDFEPFKDFKKDLRLLLTFKDMISKEITDLCKLKSYYIHSFESHSGGSVISFTLCDKQPTKVFGSKNKEPCHYKISYLLFEALRPKIDQEFLIQRRACRRDCCPRLQRSASLRS